jgi:O-antigen/teichoic acid export membrane protein
MTKAVATMNVHQSAMPESIAQSRLAMAGIISLVIKVAGAVLSYASIVAFAHLLDAEQYGRFAFGLNAAIIVAAVGNCGTSTAIMRYWPKYQVSADPARAKGAVELGYALSFWGGLILIGALGLVSLIRAMLGLPAELPFVLAIGLLGLMISFGDYSSNLLRAQGSTIVSMLPRAVLGYFALASGFGLSGTYALIISALVLLALNLWQGAHIARRVLAMGKGIIALRDFTALRPSLIPIWLSGIVYAMIQQFDVVIVGSLLSKPEAGAYFAAQKTAMMLSLVLIAGGLVTAPTMAALYHAGKLQELQRLCQKLALAIAATTFLGYLTLIVIGVFLLGLFDPSFVSAYSILLIVGFGAVIDAISGPNSYLMQMTNFERPYLKVMLSCYALVLIAQIVLVPRYGSMGAALASTSGVILWNILSVALLRRHAKLDPSLLGVFFPPKSKS